MVISRVLVDGLSLGWTCPVSPLSPGTTADPGKKSLKFLSASAASFVKWDNETSQELTDATNCRLKVHYAKCWTWLCNAAQRCGLLVAAPPHLKDENKTSWSPFCESFDFIFKEAQNQSWGTFNSMNMVTQKTERLLTKKLLLLLSHFSRVRLCATP